MMAAMAAFPIGSAWGISHAAAASRTQAQAAKASPKKYRGPSETMMWGPVQVTVTIKGKKITKATATAPMERARSNFINSQAIPMLNQEALQAQSSQVNVISGATLTSEAYIASLHSALKKAKFPTT
jgi:uncharacterized protein with FMN-binding domain